MIEEIINAILAKLRANEDLKEIYWHYGEPTATNYAHAATGEGYVSIVPIEPNPLEDVSFTTTRVKMQLFIVITYTHINEEKCDKFVQLKTEKVWQLIKDNPTWDNTVIESHFMSFHFYPSLNQEHTDWTFDKMFVRFFVEFEINPTP